MKYRVRLDLSFDAESDARALMDCARGLLSRATSTREGAENEEISFAEHEICRHDEGGACTSLERFEVRKGVVA